MRDEVFIGVPAECDFCGFRNDVDPVELGTICIQCENGTMQRTEQYQEEEE